MNKDFRDPLAQFQSEVTKTLQGPCSAQVQNLVRQTFSNFRRHQEAREDIAKLQQEHSNELGRLTQGCVNERNRTFNLMNVMRGVQNKSFGATTSDPCYGQEMSQFYRDMPFNEAVTFLKGMRRSKRLKGE